MIKVLGNNIVNAFTGGNPVNAIYSYGQLVWERNTTKIIYTSKDGQVVNPYDSTVFGGANILSNTYSNGVGIIEFDSSVTEIGQYAFKNTKQLDTMILPSSVTNIKAYAFESSGITDITIPPTVTNISGGAFFHSELISIVIPASVKMMGPSVFLSCYSLTNVSISPSLNHLDDSMFSGCKSLVSITIPDNITSIGNGLFYNCSNLSEIRFDSIVPPKVLLGTDETERLFTGNAPGRLIKVPAGSVNAYKTAQYWSNYADSIVAQ